MTEMDKLRKQIIDQIAREAGTPTMQAEQAYRVVLLVGLPWRCPECGRIETEWSYERMANDGGPICGASDDCDCDMELIPLHELGINVA